VGSRRYGFPFLFILVLAGCGKTEKERFAKARIRIKGIELRVELAVTPEQWFRGLRFRPSLPPDSGMLFLFPDSRYRTFVMTDTVIPLSIAFIESDGSIVQIEDMKPLSLSRTYSLRRVPCALEVPQGWFRKNGIKEGDRVEGLEELWKRVPPAPEQGKGDG